jgi:uncharacterized CHY-type Zn-finger protein
MTSQKVTVLDLKDLDTATIGCEHCGTRVSMKLGKRNQVPEKCPSCSQPFNENTRSRLADLLTLYTNLDVTPAKIELQVRPEPEPK